MKLGLITDIHEHVEYLRLALRHLREHQVDQIVMIGDVFQMGQEIEETCRLLAEANVIGVWGNHDYGLSFEPHKKFQTKYGAAVVDYMTSLKPSLEVEGCHFSHIEPWLDSNKIADLWYFDGPPDDDAKLERIFEAVPNRWMFAGHYHRWLLVEPDGIQDWDGQTPVQLDKGRFFVVIGALCEGSYAVFDTETCVLSPFNLPQ